MRWLLFIHRYLGILIGALMLMWCLSGTVMMYVRYPELTGAERLRHLQPIDWRGCCVSTVIPVADTARIEQFQIEMLDAGPVLRAKTNGKTLLVDLVDGHVLSSLSATDATAVATTFARAAGLKEQPKPEGLIDHDQWTVSGEFKAARPLFLFSLADPAGTRLYVSAATGRVVQVTTERQRFWNWLGAIPHWLYFTELRRNVPLWSQVVIWLSLLGCFLTGTGVFIGVQRFLSLRPAKRWSPYCGILYWHHVPGLIFGVILLSWVASGLISMNPWGFLDSDSRARAEQALGTVPLSGAQLRSIVGSLPALRRLPDIVSIDSTPLLGRWYLVASTHEGARWRFEATGASASVSGQTWTGIARRLGATTPELVTDGDAYYFSRPGHEIQPVYRIVADDEQRTRYYFNPITAQLIATFDSNDRGYRWLHQGLHTLDFTAALRERPLWDVLMLALLSGAITVAATGTYVGWRRLARTGSRR